LRAPPQLPLVIHDRKERMVNIRARRWTATAETGGER
jgi:hypothetical protein